MVTDIGISLNGSLLYSKGETVEEYLKRNNLICTSRYPVYSYGFLTEDGWHTKDDIIFDQAKYIENTATLWKERLDNYIDSLSDDTVLIGVDCHM